MLLAGVKAGELHQGHFNANQYNYLEVRPCIVYLTHSCDTYSPGHYTSPGVYKARPFSW